MKPVHRLSWLASAAMPASVLMSIASSCRLGPPPLYGARPGPAIGARRYSAAGSCACPYGRRSQP